MPTEVTGFWSYVRADDEADGGRIASLAQRLRAAHTLLTAEELSLFEDRESLEWGAEWAKRIDEALVGTTFFIPILTPSYFKSQACRHELLTFALEAERLGLKQLLLPIYWVTVPELENDPEESADEAIRLVSRFQREDLREVRLEDEDAAAFRKPVAKLAQELADRVAAASEVRDVPDETGGPEPDDQGGASRSPERPPPEPQPTPGGADLEPTPSPEDEPGIAEKIAAAEDAVPELENVLLALADEMNTVGEKTAAAGQQMEAATARGQGMKARLVITEALARELDDPAAEIERLGHEYASSLAGSDPGVQALLDLAEQSEPEEEKDAQEFVERVKELAEANDQALEELKPLFEATRQAAEFSRSLRGPIRKIETGFRGVLDGRAILDDWGRRAREVQVRRSHRAVGQRPDEPEGPEG